MTRWRAALATCLAPTVAIAVAHAQPHAPPTRATVVLVRAERASLRATRAALTSHQGAIDRCLANARAADPAPLLRLRFISATIHLARDGTASSVELSPPLVSRGLSACLAEALLDWSQGTPNPPRGAVVLRILVAAP